MFPKQLFYDRGHSISSLFPEPYETKQSTAPSISVVQRALDGIAMRSFSKTPSLDIRFQIKLFLFRLGLCSHLVSLCPLVPPGHLEPCLTSHPLALTGGGRLPGPCPCVRPRVHPCRCRVGRSTSAPSHRRKQPQRQTQTCCSSKSKAGWTKQRTRVWKK